MCIWDTVMAELGMRISQIYSLHIYVFSAKRESTRFGNCTCVKWEFLNCPPIPESYRTILESIYVQELALHKVEIGWTKWECLRKVGICWTKWECAQRELSLAKYRNRGLLTVEIELDLMSETDNLLYHSQILHNWRARKHTHTRMHARTHSERERERERERENTRQRYYGFSQKLACAK